MRMGVPTPHTRVGNSGFRGPIGQRNPAGPELMSTEFSDQEMPVSNPKNPVFCVCAGATTVAVACVSATFFLFISPFFRV